MELDLNKSLEYFNPAQVLGRIHIIGCGSVGSAVAYLLVRMGVENITLYDDDIIEPHNLGNQMFTQHRMGMNKAIALKEILCEINPAAADKITAKPEKYVGQPLSGYVFLCVDDISVRKMICERNRYNINIEMILDVRTGLETVECRAAVWHNQDEKKEMLKSVSAFTHEEVKKEQPVSACGVVLGVMSTVWLGSLLCVNNFITYIRTGKYKKCILADGFQMGILAT